jgi:hypothetical protein
MLAVLAALAFLFFQTVRDTAAAPYTIRADLLDEWTVTVEGPRDPLGALLSVRPVPGLPMALSQQIFRRHTDSMMAPAVRSIPLVLRSEFDTALQGVLSVDDLMGLAERSGITADLEPVCMAARRRNRDPGRIYFVLFESSAFARFRQEVATTLESAGGLRGTFDPAALSPLLVIAASDATFERWLPRRADADDCVAPVEVGGD